MGTEKDKHITRSARARAPTRNMAKATKGLAQYNDATREFVKSGRVEDAAENAEPRGPKEQEEMRKAEQAGRGKSKGEDPSSIRAAESPAPLSKSGTAPAETLQSGHIRLARSNIPMG